VKFDADLLRELREHTRSFIKLDLAYLAAGGAIVTALKLGRSELLEFGANAYLIAFALSVVITMDVIIESMVFQHWLAARSGSTKRPSVKAMQVLLDLQPKVHWVFVVGLILGATGFALGVEDVRKQIESRATLQESVDLFMIEKGRPPADITELRKYSSRAERAAAQLGGEAIIIEPRNTNGYKLTFAGDDHALGTEDDMVVTEDFSLRRVYERMRKPDKNGNY
jgi:hypothetical protein